MTKRSNKKIAARNASKRINAWNAAHDGIVAIHRSSMELLTSSTLVSPILRDEKFINSLTPVQLDEVLNKAEIVNAQLTKFRNTLLRLEATRLRIVEAPKENRSDVDFIELAIEYDALNNSYLDSVYPEIEKILSYTNNIADANKEQS